jgi:hypothetical protein
MPSDTPSGNTAAAAWPVHRQYASQPRCVTSQLLYYYYEYEAEKKKKKKYSL